MYLNFIRIGCSNIVYITHGCFHCESDDVAIGCTSFSIFKHFFVFLNLQHFKAYFRNNFTNTRNDCAYLTAFLIAIPNKVMKFLYFDYFFWGQFCDILDMSSAHYCREVSGQYHGFSPPHFTTRPTE